MFKWKSNQHVLDRATYRIEFRTYFNESGDSSISRLDVRSTKSETTLIIEPSDMDVRTRLMDVFTVDGFTIEPNVLPHDKAIRVVFKNSNPQQEKVRELVKLLINQEPTILELQSNLMSDLNQSICFGTLGRCQTSNGRVRMFHSYSKNTSPSVADHSIPNANQFSVFTRQ